MEGFDKDFLWLFRKSEQVAICLSLDYSIVDLTPAAETLFTVPRKEVLGSPISSLFVPFGLKISFSKSDTNPEVGMIDKKAFGAHKGKKMLSFSWQIRPKITSKGQTAGYIIYAEERMDIEYLAQVYQVVTGQGRIDQGSIKDYAENIKNYLESIIAVMPGNVYWKDKNSTYLGGNDNSARYLGLKSRKEIVGMTYDVIEKTAPWLTGKTATWREVELEVMSTSKPKLNVEEAPVILPDGKEVSYLTNMVPLFDKKKNVIGMVGISIDITDRKRMERELQLTRERAEKAEKELLIKASQEITGQVLDKEKSSVAYVKNVQNYFENIIAWLPGYIFWMDKNSILLGCNDNIARMFGFNSRKEVVGMSYEDMERKVSWAANHIDLWKQANLEVLTTGKPNLSFDELPSGEERLHLVMSRAPIFDDSKNVIGVIGIALDISDRKKLEKLQKEKEVAEKTSHFMQMLAGSLAHEIRTPLAIIGINMDLLEMLRKDKTDIDEEKHFKAIKHAVQLGARVIDNILTMLKTLSFGKEINSEFKPLSMLECINDVIAIYPFLEHERLLVSSEESGDFTYCGDRILTQHVLFNLFKNALRAIKEAEKGEIKIKLETGEQYNVLRFIDTASGVAAEDLSKIFDQFEVRLQGGAGLGLAFCKMVLQAYNGDIICRSQKGKYTEFVLSFPRTCPHCK